MVLLKHKEIYIQESGIPVCIKRIGIPLFYMHSHEKRFCRSVNIEPVSNEKVLTYP